MRDKESFKQIADLPVMPTTIGSMEWHRTGCWRYLTPTVRNKPAPCRRSCPVNISIARFIDHRKHDDADAALEVILMSNPLPGITGRLCYHPCQTNCMRGKHDRNIPVQLLERWAADTGRVASYNAGGGIEVAVVGSGPAGLSCAYFLGRSGCAVTVFDPCEKAGGFLCQVPERLPHPVLQREIDRLLALSGTRMVLNHPLSGEAGLEKNFVLVIVDATSYASETPAGGAIADFLSFGQARTPEKFMSISADGMKPSRIAHAVLLGRETAEKALRRVAPDQAMYGSSSLQEMEGPDVGSENLRFERVASPDPLDDGRQEDLKAEAERCLSCGTCNLCRLCVRFCPDACISAHADKIEVDPDYCKGCGICAYECPRGVITMEGQ
jgi:Pyruvate/2-oxoacid:ferredoxin oxidoreductase delta subunit